MINSSLRERFKETELEKACEVISFLENGGYNFKKVYLPNSLPSKKVKYIFIAMEPSFGNWAKSEEDAKEQIELGFKNFIYSKDDLLLHFSINNFLSDSYYVTDVSKIAMMGEDAKIIRKLIYPMWSEHLIYEINTFGKEECMLFALGRIAENEINNRIGSVKKAEYILHYSFEARGARHNTVFNQKKGIDFRNDFNDFKKNFDYDELENFAEKFVKDNIKNSTIRQKVFDYGVKNIKKIKSSKSDLDLKLIFCYKMKFDKINVN